MKIINGGRDKLSRSAHKKLIEFVTSPTIEAQDAAKESLIDFENRLKKKGDLRSV